MRLTTPLDAVEVKNLRAGDNVILDGVIYTARDAAHKRLVQLIDEGEELPIDLEGQAMYYVGPAPARPPAVIGPAGPTTSYRMDPYTPRLLERGLRGMIGKGPRSEKVKQAICRYGAVYFAAVGGAAALLSKCVISSEVIAYEDLGTEALRRIVVKDFPVTVINDSSGGDLYEQGRSGYRTIKLLR